MAQLINPFSGDATVGHTGDGPRGTSNDRREPIRYWPTTHTELTQTKQNLRTAHREIDRLLKQLEQLRAANELLQKGMNELNERHETHSKRGAAYAQERFELIAENKRLHEDVKKVLGEGGEELLRFRNAELKQLRGWQQELLNAIRLLHKYCDPADMTYEDHLTWEWWNRKLHPENYAKAEKDS